jgi:hypothetical protein
MKGRRSSCLAGPLNLASEDQAGQMTEHSRSVAFSTEDLRRSKCDRNSFSKKPRLPVTVVLDRVRRAYNIGAIFRLCDAIVVESLVVTGVEVNLRNRHLVQPREERGTGRRGRSRRGRGRGGQGENGRVPGCRYRASFEQHPSRSLRSRPPGVRRSRWRAWRRFAGGDETGRRRHRNTNARHGQLDQCGHGGGHRSLFDFLAGDVEGLTAIHRIGHRTKFGWTLGATGQVMELWRRCLTI